MVQPTSPLRRISPIERTSPARRLIPYPLGAPGGQVPPALVELNLGGGWIDISEYIRYENRIEITRGRTDEGAQVERGVCRMTLDNTDGRFSPRNPVGAYYGKIGRNTPIRVAVPYQGGLSFRFHGEVSEWPVKWDKTGTNVYVPIEASGILRRLTQGSTPLKSSPRRFYEAADTSSYRHLEDGPLTPFSSVSAKKNFAYGVGALGVWLPPSLHVIGITGTSTGITFANLTCPSTTGWALDFMYASDTDKAFTVRAFVAGGEAGFSFAIKFTPSSSQIELFYTPDNTGVDSSMGTTSTSDPFDNKTHHVRFTAEQNGADIDVELFLDGVSIVTDTKTSVTNGGVNEVWVFPYAGSDSTFLALGHFALFLLASAPDVTDAADAALGYVGEAAGRRVERLCEEEGIEFTPVGNLDDSSLLGPQFPDTLVTILREAGETDMGILYEPDHHLGFAYRTRRSLYNQTPGLVIDYEDSILSEVPTPVDDDQATRNTIVVTRREGESYTAVLESGPLSVQAPPDGVGVYDDQATVNVPSDVGLPDQAYWRLHLGTVDEARYPVLDFHLQRQQITEGLRLNLLDLDIGARITIDNPPDWLPPDQISTIVQGVVERIDQFEHQITFNTSPESPYQVGEYEAGEGETYRYDTPGSELVSEIDEDDAGFTVSSSGGVAWTDDADEVPFDINIGGERMTVTGISGTSVAGQSFAVTRSINGVVKSHPAGASVSLWTKAVYAMR